MNCLVSAKDFFEKAVLAVEKCYKHPEAKLRIEFEHVLKNYLEWMGFLEIEGQYEETSLVDFFIITKKRPDATYGKVIIEYEHVGVLDKQYGKEHAIRQITDDYFPTNPKEKQNFIGIVFDGKTTIFVRWVDDWIIDEREFNQDSFDLMVFYILGLYKTSFKQLSSEFGFNREETRKTINVFYKKSFNNNERAQMLFNEWELRFSSIYGNAFLKEKIKEHFKEFAKEMGIENVDEKHLIFSIHTYYGLIVKIIASEVASNLISSSESYIKMLQTGNLENGLRDIEEGKFFRGIGIENFIEGTFLSWYLDVWDTEIEENIKNIIRKLDWFDFAEFITKPEHVVDYLKNFYQEVFPKQLRHDLGEFYTPDWLAKHVVNLTNFDGDVNKRVLDPACGSGTFLIAILNKIYKTNKDEKKKEKLIPYITKNVVGFDINPVAVLTARTNYLIALSRFNFQKTIVNIPIYLTDSVVLPEFDKQTELPDEGEPVKTYKIKTSIKEPFIIPGNIKHDIAEVMQKIKENIEKKQEDIDVVRKLLKNKFNLDKSTLNYLSKFYIQLDHLNRKKQNKIWCDIIINQFATLFQEKFDFVIGNPPWVNWEFLDDNYQKHLMDINDNYGLYFTKGLESRLGRIKRDISAIFFYVCADMYLKNKGIIAFLIKPMYQIPSGKGFRNFNRLSNEFKIRKLKEPLQIMAVEDLTKENPFEINNEVSLILARKGVETKYPLIYKKWTGQRTYELENYTAEPSDDDPLSTWIIYTGEKPIGALGEFDYEINQGVNYGLKEPFFDIEILIDKGNLVQIKSEKGKIKDIEKDKIYPLLMSRHINKWKTEDGSGQKYTYCILPHTHPQEDNEVELKTEYPKTWEWLNNFREDILKRKSKVFSKKPFYSIYGLKNWDSKYKVVWVSMGFNTNFVVVSSVDDEYLGKKLILAEHVLYLIPVNNKNEAHYICAILNSSIITETLKVLSSRGKSALSKDIVSKIRLDKFDVNNTKHKKLSELSIDAHLLATRNDEKSLKKIEKEIDALVLKLCKTKKKNASQRLFDIK